MINNIVGAGAVGVPAAASRYGSGSD
jgi:hypothetical protein